MRAFGTHTTRLALLSAALLAVSGVSGCLTDDGTSFESYEEAKAAPGEVYTPDNESEGDVIEMKLLVPQDPDNVEQGEQPIVILLFDQETDEPVLDAEVTVASHMPVMGHGTSGEEDPVHQGHGVYRGQINMAMAGDWVTHVEATPPDGEPHSFEIEFRV